MKGFDGEFFVKIKEWAEEKYLLGFDVGSMACYLIVKCCAGSNLVVNIGPHALSLSFFGKELYFLKQEMGR